MAKASYYSMPLPAKPLLQPAQRTGFLKILQHSREVETRPAQNDLSRTGQHAEGHGNPPAQAPARVYAVSYKTSATKADSWVDIEGHRNLFANASLRRKFPNEVFVSMATVTTSVKNNTFMGTYHCAQGRRSSSHQRVQLPGLGYAGKRSPSIYWPACRRL